LLKIFLFLNLPCKVKNAGAKNSNYHMEKVSENVLKTSVPGIGNVYFNLQKYSTTISEEHQYIYYFDAEGKFMGGFSTA
jgi:hypothetical protein